MTSSDLIILKVMVGSALLVVGLYLFAREQNKQHFKMLEALRDHNWEE